MKQVQLNYERTSKVYPEVNIENIIHDGETFENAIQSWKGNLLNKMYPVGKLFITSDESYNPAESLIPGSNWVLIKAGKILVGKGSFTDKNGTSKQFLKELENIGVYNTPCPPVPSHQHTFSSNQECDLGSSLNDYCTATATNGQGYAGGDAPHTNIMPCYAVNIWRRLPDQIPTLEEASWEFISQMAQEGIAEYLWKVGDTKTFKNGTITRTAVILDFKGQYTENLVYDSDGQLITPKSKGITFCLTSAINNTGFSSGWYSNDFLTCPFLSSSARKSLVELEASVSAFSQYIRPVVKKRFYYSVSDALVTTLVEETINKEDNLKLWYPNSFEAKLPSNISPAIVEHFDISPDNYGVPTFDSYYYTKSYTVNSTNIQNKIYHNNSGDYQEPNSMNINPYNNFCFFI